MKNSGLYVFGFLLSPRGQYNLNVESLSPNDIKYWLVRFLCSVIYLAHYWERESDENKKNPKQTDKGQKNA